MLLYTTYPIIGKFISVQINLEILTQIPVKTIINKKLWEGWKNRNMKLWLKFLAMCLVCILIVLISQIQNHYINVNRNVD